MQAEITLAIITDMKEDAQEKESQGGMGQDEFEKNVVHSKNRRQFPLQAKVSIQSTRKRHYKIDILRLEGVDHPLSQFYLQFFAGGKLQRKTINSYFYPSELLEVCILAYRAYLIMRAIEDNPSIFPSDDEVEDIITAQILSR